MSSKYTFCYTAVNTKLPRLELYASIIGNNNPPLARFEGGIDIGLNENVPNQVKVSISVVLSTHIAGQVPRYTYSIGLHIDDDDGKLVTNQDFGLLNQSNSCKSANIDVSSLPNGTYKLYIGPYASLIG